ncbi:MULTISPECIES: S8 family peptidase [Streptococcus]|uniref:S8 family peptidase n=1 Tax=Streptococcus TaxID=1301 RepID=UPI0003F5393A|nr:MULTISPECIES: S8 family serine peptidase [Streptococcus]AUC91444.1 peptidase S8 [Streptococcus suis]MCK3935020.1 S8 family serine peptidase [Streptococcus suis]MDG3291968.1 S8 family serine peptidase [Streptococcus suis]NQN11489.1 S8 family serine peptidase [Streptococcus suis]NQO73898.1 S8 family serine peptidase [Streptococcus suis]
MKKRNLVLNIFLSSIILSFNNLPMQVKANENADVRYNILLKNPESVDDIEMNFEKQGIKVTDKIPEINFLTVSTNKSIDEIRELNDSYIEEIVANNTLTVKPNITYLYGENVYTNNSFDFWSNQWDMQKSISTGTKFRHKSTGKATIGVIDSGITYDNPQIYSNIISVKNFTADLDTGVVDEQNIIDKTGHATSVVGQISSNGEYKGIAPGMKIRMYRVFDEGNAQDQWILKAIIQAAKDDVDVINLSLGEYLLENSTDEDDNTALVNIYQRAINYAYNQGSVVVASVGDEGIDLDNQAELKDYLGSLNGKDYNQVDGFVRDIPAELDNIVTVGSVDDDDYISSFSNRGSSVDIYATGGGTKALAEVGYENWVSKKLYEKDWVIVPTLEGKFTYAYGTSIATPKVSAALGLIIEKYNLKDQPDEAIKILYDNSWLSKDDNNQEIRSLNITNFVQ